MDPSVLERCYQDLKEQHIKGSDLEKKRLGLILNKLQRLRKGHLSHPDDLTPREQEIEEKKQFIAWILEEWVCCIGLRKFIRSIGSFETAYYSVGGDAEYALFKAFWLDRPTCWCGYCKEFKKKFSPESDSEEDGDDD